MCRVAGLNWPSPRLSLPSFHVHGWSISLFPFYSPVPVFFYMHFYMHCLGTLCSVLFPQLVPLPGMLALAVTSVTGYFYLLNVFSTVLTASVSCIIFERHAGFSCMGWVGGLSKNWHSAFLILVQMVCLLASGWCLRPSLLVCQVCLSFLSV